MLSQREQAAVASVYETETRAENDKLNEFVKVFAQGPSQDLAAKLQRQSLVCFRIRSAFDRFMRTSVNARNDASELLTPNSTRPARKGKGRGKGKQQNQLLAPPQLVTELIRIHSKERVQMAIDQIAAVITPQGIEKLRSVFLAEGESSPPGITGKGGKPQA